MPQDPRATKARGKDAAKVTSTAESPRAAKDRILFKYPALSKPETIIYFIVWPSLALYAWYVVYLASAKEINPSRDYTFYTPTDGLFRGIPKDNSNWEWLNWVPWAQKIVLWLFGHSFLFNMTEPLFKRLWSPLMLLYWLTACSYVTSVWLVGITLLEGAAIYFSTRFMPHWTTVWGVAGFFLYTTVHNLRYYIELSGAGSFITIVFLTYKILQYISFCLEWLKNPRIENQPLLQGIYNMFWYAFYLPYLISIVRIYKTFADELANRLTRPRNLKHVIFFGLRILTWFCMNEFVRHFAYFDSMMQNPAILRRVRLHTLVCIGYVACQFFQMKYVVIFGFPAFFAKLDNMDPPKGPICVSRVALYTKVWRGFDRGLYQFFKEYIFLPICQPTFSLPRKIFGLCLSYTFVLLYHGVNHQHLVWVAFNVVEIIQEFFSKAIYAKFLRRPREKYLGDRMFRRILAWLQIFPMCFGLYSTFYFVGGSESGWVFVDRVFWGETVTLKYPFFLLITTGYFYTNCCMDTERWENEAIEHEHEHVHQQ